MGGCVIGLLLVAVVVVAIGGQVGAIAVGLAVVGLASWIVAIYLNTSPRAVKKRLLAKYRDDDVVNAVMRKELWLDQTEEQLVDSLGSPVARDVKHSRASHRETWRYHSISVTLQDHRVSGWEYSEGASRRTK